MRVLVVQCLRKITEVGIGVRKRQKIPFCCAGHEDIRGKGANNVTRAQKTTFSDTPAESEWILYSNVRRRYNENNKIAIPAKEPSSGSADASRKFRGDTNSRNVTMSGKALATREKDTANELGASRRQGRRA